MRLRRRQPRERAVPRAKRLREWAVSRAKRLPERAVSRAKRLPEWAAPRAKQLAERAGPELRELGQRATPLRDKVSEGLAHGVTRPPAPRPMRLRRGRLDLVMVADTLFAAILFGTALSALTNADRFAHYRHSPALLALVAFAVCVPLVLRTHFPLTAWFVSALSMLYTSHFVPPQGLAGAAYLPAGILVYALCLYAITVRCESWVVVGTSIATAIGAAFTSLHSTFPAIAVAAVPLLVGSVVRVRRSGREQLEVQERRHAGERTLLEERQRIARELHDVVAHHMSVIAIQAEAAPYKTPDPPRELTESFADIRASALSGLQELRRVLGVLRSDTMDTAPQPGLRDLDSLIESARGGGVTVYSKVSGTPRPLPGGVDLSAYRIVQEALSNAMRHAPGATVQVGLNYGDAVLVIEIRNSPRPPEQAPGEPDGSRPGGAGLGRGSGHGIIGMRERAVMLGGHLTAGPTPKGEFLVTASLPLESDRSESAP